MINRDSQYRDRERVNIDQQCRESIWNINPEIREPIQIFSQKSGYREPTYGVKTERQHKRPYRESIQRVKA